jgi:hypothetical protein
LAAQCSNPTPVPDGIYTSGDHSQVDNNALSAANFGVSGGATATFVAGKCIHLLPGFHASAIGATVPTTFHAWVETVPSVISASPSTGSGASQQFTWTVSSPSGYANLAQVYALFNTSVSGVNGCYISYSPGGNRLFLADNSGTVWTGGFYPGTSDSASNSYCTIYGSGSSVSASGNQLALTVNVAFSSSFSGTWNNYLLAQDNAGLTSEWQPMGTWTVAAAQPDFNISFTALGPTTITSGGNASYAINTGPLNGFTGPLSFSAPNWPAGISAAFTPQSLQAGASTTLVVSATGSTPANTYSLPVSVSSGGLSHTIQIPLIVQPGILVTISPPVDYITVGTSLQFVATVTGATNTAIDWQLLPYQGHPVEGYIVPDPTDTTRVTYYAPARVIANQYVRLVATSRADISKHAELDAMLWTGSCRICVMLTRSPGDPQGTLLASQVLHLVANVTGTGNTNVQWSSPPAGMGTLGITGSNTATYTAPAYVPTANTFAIVARSLDPSATSVSYGTLTVSLEASGFPPPSDFNISVTPTTAGGSPGTSITVGVSVTPQPGFVTPVTVATSNWPSGITANPVTLTAPGYSGSLEINVAPSATVSDVPYTLPINGSSGGANRSTTLQLGIRSPIENAQSTRSAVCTDNQGRQFSVCYWQDVQIVGPDATGTRFYATVKPYVTAGSSDNWRFQYTATIYKTPSTNFDLNSAVAVTDTGAFQDVPLGGTFYVPGPDSKKIVDAAQVGFGTFWLQIQTRAIRKGLEGFPSGPWLYRDWNLTITPTISTFCLNNNPIVGQQVVCSATEVGAGTASVKLRSWAVDGGAPVASYTWAADGSSAHASAYTNSDTNSPTTSMYFTTPTSPGTTAKVSYNIQYDNGYTKTVSQNLTVIAPQVQPLFENLYAKYLSDNPEEAIKFKPLDTGWVLGLGNETGLPDRQNGIEFAAQVTVPAAGIGQVAYVQLARGRYHVENADGTSGNIKDTGGRWLADPPVPYSPGAVQVPLNLIATIATSDLPSQPGITDNQTLVSADFDFQMFLMYQPPGANSIWVTLQEIDWGWSATVAHPPGTTLASVAANPFQLDGRPTLKPQLPVVNNGATSLPQWDSLVH